jgi:branched-chain amino acid aminotransferase
MNYEFKINKTTTPKQKPDIDHLEFGTTFTDHMFIMNYSEVRNLPVFIWQFAADQI